MSIQRLLAKKIQNSRKSVLLLGPRQTGKSTLIQSLAPDLSVNFADETTFTEFLSDPARLRSLLHAKIKTVFIDEVQRLPSILNTIQALIDERKDLKFYLTGSSARKLKRGKANLLPGRLVSYELGPLTQTELGQDFTLSKAMSIGLLPGIYTESDDEVAKKVLRTYATTYLREEIQAEALTRNLEGFSRFFKVVASRSGDFIDFSKFSNQAMIERTSAKRYYEILIDTLVVNEVEPFSKSSKRRLIQHPRYYFFDVGVLNGLLGSFEVSLDRIGMLFEHLVQQLIFSEAKARDIEIRVSVYRTEKNAEVDFIVEHSGKTFALEVKATKKIGAHDLRGLKSFAEFYRKPHRALVVYLGESELNQDGIQITPISMMIDEIFS